MHRDRVVGVIPRIVLSALVLSSTGAVLRGQGGVAVIRSNTIELGAYGGLTQGLETVRGNVGGNVSYSVSKYILPYFEYTYFPGLERSITTPSGNNTLITTIKQDFYDIHGGLHLRKQIKESNWAPYAAIGFGVLRIGQATPYYKLSSGKDQIPGDTPLPATNHFAINAGGGLRYYVTPHFGFRLEYKVYKATGSDAFSGLGGTTVSAAGPVFQKGQVAIFYQK